MAKLAKPRHEVNSSADRRPKTSSAPLVLLTELAPHNSLLARKTIHADGRIDNAPKILQWTVQQIRIADCRDLFDQVRSKLKLNVCLIRGAPQASTPEVTRRRKASDDYPDGFVDTPTAWLPFDVDGVRLPRGLNWQRDLEGAVKYVIDRLGDAFGEVGVTWQFTGTHGLEVNKRDDGKKIWTGKLTYDTLRLRLYYLLDRAIDGEQAVAWLRILKAALPETRRSHRPLRAADLYGDAAVRHLGGRPDQTTLRLHRRDKRTAGGPGQSATAGSLGAGRRQRAAGLGR
jgi:hypothetical protein